MSLKTVQMDGAGVYKYTNGDQYDGQMKDGKFNGFGTLLGSKGTKYVGWFVDGKV